MKLVILPIGQAAVSALQFIKHGLKYVLPKTEVTVLATVMPIPSETYNSSRRQYHSTHVLAKMSNYIRKTEARCVLGVIEADLYVPSLSFVFGEGQCPGKVAIISLFRLKPEFYGEPSNNLLFHERALKEAVHETGHTLGLRHCQDPLCIMFFSNSINDTDLKRARFCEKCEKQILKTIK